MVLINKRKGQAAIEFLMTYGWMLLVVLIVGALIFSFVDFGALLPNKVDLSGNLQASATTSFAHVGLSDDGTDSYAIIEFTYNGPRQVMINGSDGKIESTILQGEACDMVWVKNVDTGASTVYNDGGLVSTSPMSEISGISPVPASAVDNVMFLNGHVGVAEFNCSGINQNAGLFENDALEGKLSIPVESAKTGVKTPSSGTLRLTVKAD